MMRSSYKKEDVDILLKDITGLVAPQGTYERERLIQSGRHYCEMLPIEYTPSQAYMEAYQAALRENAVHVARAVAVLAHRIQERKGRRVVLVSLARAGIPAGILLKRYLTLYEKMDVPHYSISIIRGRGIDQNAMKYILDRHPAEELLFVDGWTGKGAILGELRQSLEVFPGVSPELAVLADPAYITDLCGTHEDILIPSSCLNCTVTGLISRTFLRDDIIGPNDFHGAIYYGELSSNDLSSSFIKAIEREFVWPAGTEAVELFGEMTGISNVEGEGVSEVETIASCYHIEDINLIKPGIGETTRVLLRRVPWKVLINSRYDQDSRLNHIRKLADEKGVPVENCDLHCYMACGLIRKMADT